MTAKLVDFIKFIWERFKVRRQVHVSVDVRMVTNFLIAIILFRIRIFSIQKRNYFSSFALTLEK